VLGKRRGYGQENLAPYDLSLAVIGTGRSDRVARDPEAE
jgi:hypothetical protein